MEKLQLLLVSSAGGDWVSMGVPILLMIAAVYFIIWRPEQKKKKDHENWLGSLKKGDEVVTVGGILGKVMSFDEGEQILTLEVQKDVRIRLLKTHVATKAPDSKSDAKKEKQIQPEEKK